ncbi:hypothetical protein GDO81_019134 [Engystomops pustulosus]|uniref:Uncharacterized protein n=1 Tax=Engystomops pustulosus TaxID=76066 RepID=A0AAV6YAF6_ENGPU|nr:hypothetical protein GDO81_019134 [Engystomops pustulosus]
MTLHKSRTSKTTTTTQYLGPPEPYKVLMSCRSLHLTPAAVRLFPLASLCRCRLPLVECTVCTLHSSTSGPDIGKAWSPPCSGYYVLDRSICFHSFCLCNISSQRFLGNTCSSDKNLGNRQCK